MSLRILYFIESGGPGGAERVVLDLAREFHRVGDSAAVLTLRSGWLTEELAKAGIEVLRLRPREQSRAALPFSIARLLHARGANVLHSHLLDSNFYGALGARLAGCTHVATEHGDVHHTSPKKFLRAKLRAIALLGSRLTAVSAFTARRLSELGVPAERVTVVGNPVEPVDFDPEVRTAIRGGLGVRDNEWLWIHAANLRPVKDQVTLLRGFALAQKQSPVPQRLWILGDGAERDPLMRLATELDLPVRDIFRGFQTDVSRYLRAADGFVLSSLSEALPMSILEAASAGLVLVASAVGGVPEVVIPNQTGFLFPARNHAALAETFCAAVSAPAASRALAENARKLSTRFSTGRVAEDFERLYTAP